MAIGTDDEEELEEDWSIASVAGVLDDVGDFEDWSSASSRPLTGDEKRNIADSLVRTSQQIGLGGGLSRQDSEYQTATDAVKKKLEETSFIDEVSSLLPFESLQTQGGKELRQLQTKQADAERKAGGTPLSDAVISKNPLDWVSSLTSDPFAVSKGDVDNALGNIDTLKRNESLKSIFSPEEFTNLTRDAAAENWDYNEKGWHTRSDGEFKFSPALLQDRTKFASALNEAKIPKDRADTALSLFDQKAADDRAGLIELAKKTPTFQSFAKRAENQGTSDEEVYSRFEKSGNWVNWVTSNVVSMPGQTVQYVASQMAGAAFAASALSDSSSDGALAKMGRALNDFTKDFTPYDVRYSNVAGQTVSQFVPQIATKIGLDLALRRAGLKGSQAEFASQAFTALSAGAQIGAENYRTVFDANKDQYGVDAAHEMAMGAFKKSVPLGVSELLSLDVLLSKAPKGKGWAVLKNLASSLSEVGTEQFQNAMSNAINKGASAAYVEPQTMGLGESLEMAAGTSLVELAVGGVQRRARNMAERRVKEETEKIRQAAQNAASSESPQTAAALDALAANNDAKSAEKVSNLTTEILDELESEDGEDGAPIPSAQDAQNAYDEKPEQKFTPINEGVISQDTTKQDQQTSEPTVTTPEPTVTTPPTLRESVIASGIPEEAADSYISNLQAEGISDEQIQEMADNGRALREETAKRNEAEAQAKSDLARRARAGDPEARAQLERERGVNVTIPEPTVTTPSPTPVAETATPPTVTEIPPQQTTPQNIEGGDSNELRMRNQEEGQGRTEALNADSGAGAEGAVATPLSAEAPAPLPETPIAKLQQKRAESNPEEFEDLDPETLLSDLPATEAIDLLRQVGSTYEAPAVEGDETFADYIERTGVSVYDFDTRPTVLNEQERRYVQQGKDPFEGLKDLAAGRAKPEDFSPAVQAVSQDTPEEAERQKKAKETEEFYAKVGQESEQNEANAAGKPVTAEQIVKAPVELKGVKGEVSGKSLPVRQVVTDEVDDRGVAITKVVPGFVNDANTMAEVLSQDKGVNRVYVPKEDVANLDPEDIFIKYDESGNPYVVAARHGNYGVVYSDTGLTQNGESLADLHEPTRQRNSQAQIQGKRAKKLAKQAGVSVDEVAIPEMTDKFTERVNNAPISKQETEKPEAVAKTLKAIQDKAMALSGEAVTTDNGLVVTIDAELADRIGIAAANLYMARLRGVDRKGKFKDASGVVADIKKKVLAKLKKRPGARSGVSLDQNVGDGSSTVGDLMGQTDQNLDNMGYADVPLDTQVSQNTDAPTQGPTTTTNNAPAGEPELSAYDSITARAMSEAEKELGDLDLKNGTKNLAVWKETLAMLNGGKKRKDLTPTRAKIVKEMDARMRERMRDLISQQTVEADTKKAKSVLSAESKSDLTSEERSTLIKTNLDKIIDWNGGATQEKFDIKRVLLGIAEDPKQPQLVKIFAKFIGSSNVDFSGVSFETLASLQKDKNWAGLYTSGDSSSTGKIQVNVGSFHRGSIGQTIVHEALHHVAFHKLRPSYNRTGVEREAYRDLRKILTHIRRQVLEPEKGRTLSQEARKMFSRGGSDMFYGLSDLDELFTETLTNTRFSVWMSTQAPLPDIKLKNTNIFKNLYEQVKQLFKNLIGGQNVRSDSLLSQAMDNILALAQDPQDDAKIQEYRQKDKQTVRQRLAAAMGVDDIDDIDLPEGPGWLSGSNEFVSADESSSVRIQGLSIGGHERAALNWLQKNRPQTYQKLYEDSEGDPTSLGYGVITSAMEKHGFLRITGDSSTLYFTGRPTAKQIRYLKDVGMLLDTQVVHDLGSRSRTIYDPSMGSSAAYSPASLNAAAVGNPLGFEFKTQQAIRGMFDQNKRGALKGLTASPDGTVPWENLMAKLTKAFSAEEADMVLPALESMANRGRVNVAAASEALQTIANAKARVTVLSAENAETDQTRSGIIHALDTDYPGWGLDDSQYIDDPIFMGLRDELDSMDRGKIKENESATARFKMVNPKPLDEMDDAGDIVVEDSGSKVFGEAMHFPTRKNVIGFGRKYTETLPSGEEATFVFEVQSDWAKKAREESEGRANALAEQERFVAENPNNEGAEVELARLRRQENAAKVAQQNNPDSPLLSVYENLVLKAAIQDALAKGQTKLILTDAETAMMTEQHDKFATLVKYFQSPAAAFNYYSTLPDVVMRAASYTPKEDASGRWTVALSPTRGSTETQAKVAEIAAQGGFSVVISQEPGMRAAYDTAGGRLHNIMRKLTGDKGSRVDLGEHQNIRGVPNEAVGIELGEIQRRFDADEITADQMNQQMRELRKANPKGSPVFKNPDGTPKTNITGVVYDLTSILENQEKVRALFAAPVNPSATPNSRVAKVDMMVQSAISSMRTPVRSANLNGHPAQAQMSESGELEIVYDPEAIAIETEGLNDEEAASTISKLLGHENLHIAGMINDYSTPDSQGRVGRKKIEAFHDEVMTDEMRQETADAYVRRFDGMTDAEYQERKDEFLSDKVSVAGEYKRMFTERYLTGESYEDSLKALENKTGDKFADIVRGIADYLMGRIRMVMARYQLTKDPRLAAVILNDSQMLQRLSSATGMLGDNVTEIKSETLNASKVDSKKLYDIRLDIRTSQPHLTGERAGLWYPKVVNGQISNIDTIPNDPSLRFVHNEGMLGSDVYTASQFRDFLYSRRDSLRFFGRNSYSVYKVGDPVPQRLADEIGIDPLSASKAQIRRMKKNSAGDTDVEVLSAASVSPKQTARWNELTADLQGRDLTQADLDAWKKANPEKYAELEKTREDVLKAAGYTTKGMHYTTAPESRLPINKFKEWGGMKGLWGGKLMPIWFTDSYDYIEGLFSKSEITKRPNRNWKQRDKRLSEYLINFGRNLDLTGLGEKATGDEMESFFKSKGLTTNDEFASKNTQSVHTFMRNSRGRRFLYENGYDSATMTEKIVGSDKTATTFFVYDAERIKSAEPLNLENGRLVTPTEWAQPENPDIRFASRAQIRRMKRNSAGWKASGWFGQGLMDKQAWNRVEQQNSEMRGANYRVQETARQFDKLVKKYKPDPVTLQEALGSTDNVLTDAQYDNWKKMVKAAKSETDATKRQAAIAASDSYRISQIQTNNAQKKADRLAALGQLPQDLRDVVDTMRKHIDQLSKTMIAEGIVGKNLQATLGANMEVYLNRSYEVFDNPEWSNFILTDQSADSLRIRNNAATIFRSQLVAEEARKIRRNARLNNQAVPTRQQALAAAQATVTSTDVTNLMEDYLRIGDGSAADMFLGGRVPGKKDTSIITLRGQIPKELRELMGEYKDAGVNYAKSYLKMASFIANHNFQKDFLDMGLTRSTPFLWKEGVSPGRRPLGWEKVYSNLSDSPNPNPMADVYGPPIVAEAFRELNKTHEQLPVMKFVTGLTGIAMASKTIYNPPQTYVRNFAGNGLLMLAQGYLTNDISKLGFFKRFGISTYTTGEKLFGVKATRSNQVVDYIEKLTSLGVMGDNVKATVIKDLTSVIFDRDPKNAFNEKLSSVFSLAKKGNDRLIDAYQAGDDFWKVLAFESERATFEKAYPKATPEALDRMAADRVRAVLPTYSVIPKFVKDIVKGQPYLAPYISWTSEIIRTTLNTFKFGIEDVRSGNPALQKSGLVRLGSMLVAQGLLVSAAGTIRSFAQMDDDDEDALRRFLPEWQVNALIALTGKTKDGKVSFWDLSYLNPFDVIQEPFTAMTNEYKQGGSGLDVAAAGLDKAMDPWTGEQLFFGAVADVARGYTKEGYPLYEKADSDWNNFKKGADRIWSAVKPGAVNFVERIVKAYNGEISNSGRVYNIEDELKGAILGQKPGEVDLLQVFQNKKLGAFNRMLESANNLSTKEYRNQGSADLEKIKENYRQSNSARLKAFVEIKKDVDALVRMGVPAQKIYAAMEFKGLSRMDMEQVIKGRYVRKSPSNESLARAYAVPNYTARVRAIREARDSYPEVQSIISE